MKYVILVVLALGIGLVPLPAQLSPSLGDQGVSADPTTLVDRAVFDLWTSTLADGKTEIHATLDRADGTAFAVLASLGGDAFDVSASVLLGIAPLDGAGHGDLFLTLGHVPQQNLHAVALYEFCGCYVVTPESNVIMDDPIVCDHLDFDFTLGDDSVMVAGRPIAEQWADIGMHVSARAAAPSKPDMAILFDSDVPSALDPDLVVGMGCLLILPEDDLDVAPADGLVDVPNDAAAGGSLVFDFERGVQIDRIGLVDIDEAGSELRFYKNHDTLTPDCVIPIPQEADGSVQTLMFHKTDVTRLEVFLKGSGGVAGVCAIPCPRVIDFDESTFGRPLGIPAGTRVHDEFIDMGLGVMIHAQNAWVGGTGEPGQNHPDVAVLFDSDAPTGGDTDLGCGLGKILVIAEDDLDVAPSDGLVDDPDDEAQGGILFVDFGRTVSGMRLTLVDIDEAAGPNEVRCYDEADVMMGTPIPLIVGPDGSIQTVTAELDGLRRLEIVVRGSAALAEVRYCLR